MVTCILLRQCGHRALEWCVILRDFARSSCCSSAPPPATPQTTQGLISGQLADSVTGRPIAAANVFYSSTTSNLAGAAASDASGYYYLPLLSPGIYRDPSNCACLSIAGSTGAGSDRGGAHRARFPSASAQRRLGIRPIQERFSPRTKDHRHVLWSRCRPQQVGIVRSAEGPQRTAGIHCIGSDRLRRNRQSSAARAATSIRCWLRSPASLRIPLPAAGWGFR